MHLIEDYQPALVIRQVQFGVGEPRPVSGRFKVEVHRVNRLGDFEGESRLTDLARSEQRDGGVLRKQFVQSCL